MPAVLATEEASFEFPWQEEDFIRTLRQRNCVGMVAEVNDEVAGYMIYELHKNRIHLLNFAVNPAFRNRGVGTAMIVKLIGKLSHERLNRIMLEVRETNLEAQLFFKAMGFRAVSVLRDFYDGSDEDAYLLQYRYSPNTEGDLERIRDELAGPSPMLPNISQSVQDNQRFASYIEKVQARFRQILNEEQLALLGKLPPDVLEKIEKLNQNLEPMRSVDLGPPFAGARSIIQEHELDEDSGRAILNLIFSFSDPNLHP